MKQSQSIPWIRISAEGAAIVASILFAFAIDAWWEDRQQIASDETHLATVVVELRAHETLLTESISAHRKTISTGASLIPLFSANADEISTARASQLFADMMSFYQINAPFGALETAMSAGTIARMKNTKLASALANWPVAVDDLLEEQRTGRDLMFSLFAKMASVSPMTDVFREKLQAPTIRGTDVAVESAALQLAQSELHLDVTAIFASSEIEGAVLMQMALAQAAEAEATSFAAQLRSLIEGLEACIADSNC